MVLAALAFPISKIKHAPQITAGSGQDDLTVDLDDLHLRPADPGDDSGMQVTADPATMRRLEDKLARESAGGGDVAGNSLNSLVNRARDMAGNLQSKLTGQQTASKQRLNLRLADADQNQDQDEIHRAPETRKNRHGEVAGQFKQDQPKSNDALDLPREDDSRQPNAQPSPNGTGEAGVESDAGKDNPNKTTARATAASSRAARTAATAARRTESAPIRTACSARRRRRSSAPRVSRSQSKRGPSITARRAPVTPTFRPKCARRSAPNQEPDEPVARAAVPADDRSTIKRVFER